MNIWKNSHLLHFVKFPRSDAHMDTNEDRKTSIWNYLGMIRARQALSNGASVAKFGFDTPENELRKGSQNGASKCLRWWYSKQQAVWEVFFCAMLKPRRCLSISQRCENGATAPGRLASCLKGAASSQVRSEKFPGEEFSPLRRRRQCNSTFPRRYSSAHARF